MQIERNQTEPLLPFYVYVLADPHASNEIFYVGMGRNQRVLDHWKQAKKDICNELSPTHPKQVRMQKIADAGGEPKQIVIGRFETQYEAFAVESTLINWVYGYNNLTNKNRGHNPYQIRPVDNWDALPGIDVERQNRDGGEMTLVDLNTRRPIWIQDKGRSADLGLELFEYLIEYSKKKNERISQRGLKTAFRVVNSRITLFLDDLKTPALPERRSLPYPLCRIRMDGVTTQKTLQVGFTKGQATEVTDIFRKEDMDEMDRLGLRLDHGGNQARYDLLVPSTTNIDKQSLHRIVDKAFDAALNNWLE